MAWVDAGDAVQSAVQRARRAWPKAPHPRPRWTLPMIRARPAAGTGAVQPARKRGEIHHRADPRHRRRRGRRGGPEGDRRRQGLPPSIAEWIAADDLTTDPPAVPQGHGGWSLPHLQGHRARAEGRLTAGRNASGGAVLAIRLPVPRLGINLPDGERSLIPIVDDEPQIQRFLGHALTAAGYTCTCLAGNGAEALAQIAAQEPDLVILDLVCPAERQGGDRAVCATARTCR